MSKSYQWRSVYNAVLKKTGDEDQAIEAADKAVEKQERRKESNG